VDYIAEPVLFTGRKEIIRSGEPELQIVIIAEQSKSDATDAVL